MTGKDDAAYPTSKEDGWSKYDDMVKSLYCQLVQATCVRVGHKAITEGSAAEMMDRAKMLAKWFFSKLDSK